MTVGGRKQLLCRSHYVRFNGKCIGRIGAISVQAGRTRFHVQDIVDVWDLPGLGLGIDPSKAYGGNQVYCHYLLYSIYLLYFQFVWRDTMHWIDEADIDCVKVDLVPSGLRNVVSVATSGHSVLAGGLHSNVNKDSIVGVCNNVSYIDTLENGSPVSELHFLPPGYLDPPGTSIHRAFDSLIRSVSLHRHGQVDKSQRQAAMVGAYWPVFFEMAEKEPELGPLVSVEGDRLKVWFESVEDLQRAVGDVQFNAVYSVGTPFILKPPFGILWSPMKKRCWIRCNPEEVILASGQNYSSAVDKKKPGYKDCPTEDFEALKRVMS